MRYQTYTPAPPLADYVEWIWHYDGSTQPHMFERVLPTGTIELVINLCEDELRTYDSRDLRRKRVHGGALVVGPQTESFVVDTLQQASIMGVHFKPGGAYPFVGMNVHELTDRHVGLGDVWNSDAGRLCDRLREAKDATARFRIMEQALLARVRRPLDRHPAVAYALAELSNAGSTKNVTELTRDVGLSARHFIKLFNEEVGLTPKLFQRIRRFQEVLRIVHDSSRVEWSRVAHQCGYYDQAHFIHETGELTGHTPRELLTPEAFLSHFYNPRLAR